MNNDKTKTDAMSGAGLNAAPLLESTPGQTGDKKSNTQDQSKSDLIIAATPDQSKGDLIVTTGKVPTPSIQETQTPKANKITETPVDKVIPGDFILTRNFEDMILLKDIKVQELIKTSYKAAQNWVNGDSSLIVTQRANGLRRMTENIQKMTAQQNFYDRKTWSAIGQNRHSPHIFWYDEDGEDYIEEICYVPVQWVDFGGDLGRVYPTSQITAISNALSMLKSGGSPINIFPDARLRLEDLSGETVLSFAKEIVASQNLGVNSLNVEVGLRIVLRMLEINMLSNDKSSLYINHYHIPNPLALNDSGKYFPMTLMDPGSLVIKAWIMTFGDFVAWQDHKKNPQFSAYAKEPSFALLETTAIVPVWEQDGRQLSSWTLNWLEHPFHLKFTYEDTYNSDTGNVVSATKTPMIHWANLTAVTGPRADIIYVLMDRKGNGNGTLSRTLKDEIGGNAVAVTTATNNPFWNGGVGVTVSGPLYNTTGVQDIVTYSKLVDADFRTWWEYWGTTAAWNTIKEFLLRSSNIYRIEGGITSSSLKTSYNFYDTKDGVGNSLNPNQSLEFPRFDNSSGNIDENDINAYNESGTRPDGRKCHWSHWTTSAVISRGKPTHLIPNTNKMLMLGQAAQWLVPVEKSQISVPIISAFSLGIDNNQSALRTAFAADRLMELLGISMDIWMSRSMDQNAQNRYLINTYMNFADKHFFNLPNSTLRTLWTYEKNDTAYQFPLTTQGVYPMNFCRVPIPWGLTQNGIRIDPTLIFDMKNDRHETYQTGANSYKVIETTGSTADVKVYTGDYWLAKNECLFNSSVYVDNTDSWRKAQWTSEIGTKGGYDAKNYFLLYTTGYQAFYINMMLGLENLVNTEQKPKVLFHDHSYPKYRSDSETVQTVQLPPNHPMIKYSESPYRVKDKFIHYYASNERMITNSLVNTLKQGRKDLSQWDSPPDF
jgi:hypothetical protein